uniref:NADH dehydrogenase subunit 6 n=1 Tax=Harpovoluta charcoti TaxID=2783712 RepID=A0A872PJP2_9CAEN|nr:NADH dehydrogenase subunit 6 [Harpovoluta charcoti]
MSALIMISLTFSSLIIIPLMTQPLSLGLSIMFSTLLMCLISSMTLSSWYGYILFLIYVGGLLVMFAYVAALSPNVLFGSSASIVIFILSVILVSALLYFYSFIDVMSLGSVDFSMKLGFVKTFGVEMVCPKMISILIGLAVILLINLVVVVKICYYQHASLRPFSA